MGKLFSLLVVFCLIASFALADIGTRPADMQVQKVQKADSVMLEAASTGLQPVVDEKGKISLSMDALGTTGSSGFLQINKPEGATVRKAYFMAVSTGFSYYQITNSDITLAGTPVSWESGVANSINSYNYWADVTDIVKPLVDGAAAGTVDIAVTETKSYNIDGVVLAVIFDDPNQVNDNTVILAFGAQNVAGDNFAIGLAEPIDKSKQGFMLDMSLGISFGYQPTSQFSQIDINGDRLTSSAGGQDDGANSNGALITAGGFGDTNDNPADPYEDGYSGPRYDDELYNLIPFVEDGDTSIDAYTYNPSDDDNIFFAGFFLGSTTAVVGEGILLSPTSATNLLGSEHTVVATVQNDLGEPIEAVEVTFEIVSGPNAGMTYSELTDVDGKAYFTYTGNTEGTDTIEASFTDSQDNIQVSNQVEKNWIENAIPEFTALGVIVAALAVMAFMFYRKE
jgi:hypothetical protein